MIDSMRSDSEGKVRVEKWWKEGGGGCVDEGGRGVGQVWGGEVIDGN